MAAHEPERTDELIFKLLSDAELPQPDEVSSDPDSGELILLWHEQRVAVVVERDDSEYGRRL